jgi:hypothetical protein
MLTAAHRDNHEDTSAVTVAMTKRWWQRCQRIDDARATTATMPKGRQRRDDGNSARVTQAMTPVSRQQRWHRSQVDARDDASAETATTVPLQQPQSAVTATMPTRRRRCPCDASAATMAAATG